MKRELCIDRAIYLVDDSKRQYRFLRRNPEWQALDPADNLRNKRSIDGYMRIFRDGTTKLFRYEG